MSQEATVENVADYLVRECGLYSSVAKELVEKHDEVVQQGISNRSFSYYVAGRVLEAEMKELGVDELPDDWEGYDPGWVEPDDEEDEDGEPDHWR